MSRDRRAPRRDAGVGAVLRAVRSALRRAPAGAVGAQHRRDGREGAPPAFGRRPRRDGIRSRCSDRDAVRPLRQRRHQPQPAGNDERGGCRPRDARVPAFPRALRPALGCGMSGVAYATLDAQVDATHADAVAFLRDVVRAPTDTPPGDNAPHAEHTARLLEAMGFTVERHRVDDADVRAAGLVSIVNLVVRRTFGPGPVIALNAHGDVVPPGEGWTHPPYEGVVEQGRMYVRGVAVSKSDFATYAFALRAVDR